ncbi:hypothetical protein [Aliidiomarina haloalkalitolerans]|nr:hypothetical protein [Aliidiomarina haloalkalitolerans]
MSKEKAKKPATKTLKEKRREKNKNNKAIKKKPGHFGRASF